MVRRASSPRAFIIIIIIIVARRLPRGVVRVRVRTEGESRARDERARGGALESARVVGVIPRRRGVAETSPRDGRVEGGLREGLGRVGDVPRQPRFRTSRRHCETTRRGVEGRRARREFDRARIVRSFVRSTSRGRTGRERRGTENGDVRAR